MSILNCVAMIGVSFWEFHVNVKIVLLFLKILYKSLVNKLQRISNEQVKSSLVVGIYFQFRYVEKPMFYFYN